VKGPKFEKAYEHKRDTANESWWELLFNFFSSQKLLFYFY